MGIGRPSKLTPERVEKICQLARECQSRTVQSALSGIDISTLHAWLAQGRADKKALLETPFSDFLASHSAAEADAEAEMVSHVKKAARDDWRASSWYLSRARRGNYGDKQEIEHKGDGLQQHIHIHRGAAPHAEEGPDPDAS